MERGLLDGKSMLLAMPTASGKTLLAELAMLKAALAREEVSLHRASARPGHREVRVLRKFRELGIEVGISTGDFDKRDERLGRNQIIIATSEKADSLMRNGAAWVRDLAVLVVDEIHLLNDPGPRPHSGDDHHQARQAEPRDAGHRPLCHCGQRPGSGGLAEGRAGN